MQVVISILFDGLAYGMMLFVIAVGLSVTMGLMGFVNLAHGAFAMLGGYVTISAMSALGVPFLAGAGDRVRGGRRRQRGRRAAALRAPLRRRPSSIR